MIPYELPCRLWVVVSADIFVIKNKMLLCIVDYHSKIPILKKVDSLAAYAIV